MTRRFPEEAVTARRARLQRRRIKRMPKTAFFAFGRILKHALHIARNISYYLLFVVVWQNPLLRRALGPVLPKLGRLHQHSPRKLDLSAFDTNIKPDAHPKLSIVTPSYQQGEFIGRTIDSVLDQAYPAMQYVVQDGGSSDSTAAVAESYGDRLNFESRPDNGQSHAINLGFSKTDGEIMAYLNSDDMLLPGSIARVIDYFNQHPEVDAVYGDRLMIDEHDRLVGRWILPYHDSDVLSWADYVPQETLFWRRSIWDRAGGQIDESFNFAMDWDLLLRFRNAGARFQHLPFFLGAFRVHSSQKTNAEIDDTGYSDMKRLRLRELGEEKSPIDIRRACRPFVMNHWRRDLNFVTKRIPGDLPEYREDLKIPKTS